MSRHLETALDQLKDSVLAMGPLVEQNVAQAIRAVEVIVTDSEIDQRDVAIGEECLHILALDQPVTSTMRFVAAVLTINKDLERIGDLAEQTIILSKLPVPLKTGFTFEAECGHVLKMVRDSLNALVGGNPRLAREVFATEPAVNELHRGVYDQIKAAIRANPDDVDRQIIALVASRQLERIADHAVNIAEDVIYMNEGQIVRHNHRKLDASSS